MQSVSASHRPATYKRMRRAAIIAAFSCLVCSPDALSADYWANGTVPMADHRDMRQVVVRTITAHLSNNAMAVAVYGATPELLAQVKAAVRDAHAKGWPVLGIVIGSLGEPQGVDIYADGLLIAEQSKPGANIHAQTLSALGYGADLLKHELKPRTH